MDTSTYSAFRESISKASKSAWAPSRKETLSLAGRGPFDYGEVHCSPEDEACYLEARVTPDTAVLIAALLSCDPETYNKAKALLAPR